MILGAFNKKTSPSTNKLRESDKHIDNRLIFSDFRGSEGFCCCEDRQGSFFFKKLRLMKIEEFNYLKKKRDD